MVLAIEPLHVPAFKRGFQGKDEEVLMRVGLNANANHHPVLGATGLVFQEEIMIE
jgi:hypothetical protein